MWRTESSKKPDILGIVPRPSERWRDRSRTDSHPEWRRNSSSFRGSVGDGMQVFSCTIDGADV